MKMEFEIAQSLELVGGATQSIFPKVEALLLGVGDYAEALEYVAARKNMNKYKSMVDFLFCEMNTQYRFHCQAYYRDSEHSLSLKQMITHRQHYQFNKQMLVALEVAHQSFAEKRRESWGWYRKRVEEAVKAA